MWRVGTEGHIAQNVVEFYRTRFSIRPVVEPYAVLQQEIYLRTIRGEGELTAFGGCHLFAGGRLLAQEYAFQFRACLVDEIRRQHYSFVGVDKDTRLHLPSPAGIGRAVEDRSEEHTSELQSLMRISYA